MPPCDLCSNERLAQYQTAMQYFGADGLGSVRQLYDASGQVVGNSRYDPYGNVMSQGGATSVFAYAGEQRDATGLTYLRARYYSSAQGRFMTRDMWEGDPNAPMSYNEWLYVYSDPVNGVDPRGMQCSGPNCPRPVPGWTAADVQRDPITAAAMQQQYSDPNNWLVFPLAGSSTGVGTYAVLHANTLWDLMVPSNLPPGLANAERAYGLRYATTDEPGIQWVLRGPTATSGRPLRISSTDSHINVPWHLNVDTMPPGYPQPRWLSWNHQTFAQILADPNAPDDLKAFAKAAQGNWFYSAKGMKVLTYAGRAMLVIGLAMDAYELKTAVDADSQAAGQLAIGYNTKLAIGRIAGATLGAAGGAAAGGIVCSEAGAGAVVCIAVGGAIGGVAGSISGETVARYLCRPGQQSIFVVMSER